MLLMNRAPQSIRTYFLTFVCAKRQRLFHVERYAAPMRDTLQHYRGQKKFALHAFVIMPDHVHVLLTPAEDTSLERAIQLIKGGFSFRLRSKTDVWERGHFGKRIQDRAAYHACTTYIEQNPVRARLSMEASEYGFSSISSETSTDPCPEWLT